VQERRKLVAIAAAIAAGALVVVTAPSPPVTPRVTPAVVHSPTAPAPAAKPKEMAQPKPRPKARRSIEHRKVIRPAPKMVKREAAPAQRPKQQKRERVTVKKQRTATRGLPSCSYVKREYDRMNSSQRWAAYMAASSEQVAHGRRCLGF
jgi:outer membrane biosynthesis protein TonB